MSPQSKLASGTVRSDINVTPLVDVCLVLLVIFMVVTPMIQAGVKVDLPKTAKAPALPGEQNELAVTIRQDGTLWVRGTQTADGDLRNVLAAIHQAEPDREVIVRGDRRLQYEKVSEVLTTLSDVGFARIGLVTERKPAG
jgi:biopolymer transport protein TolR